MISDEQLAQLAEFGYEVALSHPDGVYSVSAPWLDTYVQADDDEAWASLLNSESVAEAEQQLEETTEETMERHQQESA